MKKQKPVYLAFDSDNHDFVEFDTIKEARDYLEEGFLDPNDGYSQYTTDYKIYKLVETVDLKTVAEKKNYTDEEWEDQLGYDSQHDVVCEHSFNPVLKEWSVFERTQKTATGWKTEEIKYMGDFSNVDLTDDWRFRKIPELRKQVKFIRIEYGN